MEKKQAGYAAITARVGIDCDLHFSVKNEHYQAIDKSHSPELTHWRLICDLVVSK